MKAATQIQPIELLSPKVIRHLQPSINHYFDFKESQHCFELYERIKIFLNNVCGHYDEDVWQLGRGKVGGKSLDDWISWYVDVITQVQASTLNIFSDFIVRKESFDIGINNKLPCALGQKHIKYLAESYELAYGEFIRTRHMIPLSIKHQKKHIERKNKTTWTPYLAEFIPCGCA